MMHVSTSFQIVFISSWLKSLLPAMLNMVCSAASVFPFVFLIWSSIVPLLFIVVPRYLYVVVLSRFICPSLKGVSGCFPIVIVWLFSWPNFRWYLFDISSVMFSIFWSSSLFLWIRATSSIHSRHPCIWLSPIFVIPVFFSLISLAISSMRFAYSITDSTPPCLMLSLIFIGLVFPNLVLIFAVRFLLMFFTRFHSFSFSPLLLRAYSMAFSQALSYAFVTSRNAMCRSWFFVCVFVVFNYCVQD